MNAQRILAAVFLMSVPLASAQAPVPVVERTVTQGEVATRVSLFSNRVIVVTTRRDDIQDFVRHVTLPQNEYLVYLEALEANAKKLGENPISSHVSSSNAEVTLTLHVGPDAPCTLTFSPLSSLDLPLARIMAAMDDLEQQALDANPAADAIRSWVPHKGDRVELLNGTFATVVEVWDDGLLILEHDLTYLREAVAPDVRDQVILRILEPEP
jgi:hypothetical protein